jgi:polyisoprenoid-binding protein YceI
MQMRRAPDLAALLAAAALVAGLAPAAHAAPTTWTIDPNHSNVSFTIRHFFSKVTGTFQKFSGTVVYDPANPAASSAKAEIDASSIYTANDKRDAHLKSPDFFDVAKYPTLTFESTKVTKDGDKLKIEGNLTMHGVTKPVTLEGDFMGSGPAMGGQRAGFEASAKVDRKDFGIIWNKVVDQGTMLGDDVEIRLAVEAMSGEGPGGGPKKADAGGAGSAKTGEKKAEASAK